MPIHRPAIEYIDKTYRSILFRGFHHQPEQQAHHGWVYWLPKYMHTHTSLKIYFHTNKNELCFLDETGAIQPLEKQALQHIDIFFGRTLGSFNPDDPLQNTATLKILYPVGNRIPKSFHKHGLAIIEDRTFVKPIPEYDRQFFYCRNTRRENILLYPAAIHNRKGQLRFAKKVTRQALKGKKILFCGTIKSENYAEECFDILRKKNIDFEYLNKLGKHDLGELYRKTAMTLIFSHNDWNPRTFYESMACGTPSFISGNVKLAETVKNHAFRASPFLFNKSLCKSLDYPIKMHTQLADFSLNLSEEFCYNQLFANVLATLPVNGENGKRVQP